MKLTSKSAIGFGSIAAPGAITPIVLAFFASDASRLVDLFPFAWASIFLGPIVLPFVRKKEYTSFTGSVEFCSGARLAISVLAIVSSLLFLALRSFQVASLITLAFAFTLIGSFLLLNLPLLGAYAAQALSTGGFDFLRSTAFGGEVAGLALVSQSRRLPLIKKNALNALLVVPFVSFYFRGWYWLWSLGSVSAVALGLLVVLVLVASGQRSLHKVVTPDGRQQLVFLFEKVRTDTIRGGILGYLILLFFVAIITIAMWRF